MMSAHSGPAAPIEPEDHSKRQSKGQKNLGVVIVAAGGGTRMGSGPEKQFRMLAGKPVLAHSVDRFLSHPNTGQIMVVVAGNRMDAARNALGELANHPRVSMIKGGVRRQDSVHAGLQALAHGDPDMESSTHEMPEFVAIHDAARPLISTEVIDALLAAMKDGADAALPTMPVVDTLKQAQGDQITGTTDRSCLVRAQTPQVFRLDDILQRHLSHDPNTEITDDIRLVEDGGGKVAAVAGDEKLMKLTTAEDFAILEALATSQHGDPMNKSIAVADIRTGNGYDVHRFSDEPGPVYIGGIEIPSERGLDAHSDGDVGLHAICDAIFGALADGDIGSHFPPSDDKWKGASSDQFLTFAANRCANRGAIILHLDLTLICELPKMGPHRDRMRQRIADLAGIDLDRVAVKATTSERLGFTGRGEGIAAQATATLQMGIMAGAE